MESGEKLAVIEALLQVQAKATDRIEASLKEWRAETAETIRAHERATQDKLDHARRNSEAKFDAIERKLAEKVDHSDLADNQARSDERWVDVQARLDRKADVLVQNVVFGVVSLILTGVVTGIMTGLIHASG